MSKKSRRQSLPNSLLDTSIFYERLKLSLPVFSSKLDRLSKGQKFGVYYSLIELNLGLLQTWVEFYKLVQSYQNAADAIAFSTNWYGRKSSTVGILHSLNARINNVVNCDDVDRYLDYLESSIANAVTILEALVKDFLGELSKHPLAKLFYLTRDDYAEFIATCKTDKIVPIAGYLEQQKDKLNSLSQHIDKVLTEHNTKENRKLKQLVTEAIDNPKNCDKLSNNLKYGDIFISLDAPKSQILISKDAAFEVLCGGLGKQYLMFVN